MTDWEAPQSTDNRRHNSNPGISRNAGRRLDLKTGILRMTIRFNRLVNRYTPKGRQMALVHIPTENRSISEVGEVNEFLSPYGIRFENWDVAGRVSKDATDEQILAAYHEEIERLKQTGGFVTADVINVQPETPGLDEMLAKFDKEHTHSEDEIRFTVEGSGVFHIHPENGPVFSITVESGDLINVPKGTRHWFNLCESRTIRCIRLFEDKSGWTPHYVENGVHQEYEPVCMGPQYFPVHDENIKPVIDL